MYSNYPAGAEFDRHAPYNEPSIDGMEINVAVEYIMSGRTTIFSPKAFEEYDEDGRYEGVNTFNSNLEEDFKECHYTPMQLIQILKKEMESKLANITDTKESNRVKDIIDECSMWTDEDDISVCSLE